ncbi:MAG: HD domain-containing protein [Candidatus Daviesbacteria bacterium]|nr:HD domain-containing protein [Candidatus Daviesbacteria bacterium]
MSVLLPNQVKSILEKFVKADYKIYIVGGAPRDILMNRPVNDWDFTTDAKPDEILKLFPEGFNDNKFGTVGISFDNKVYEITTMRKEGIYVDFRHPVEVYWTNKIEEDLARRDFTINAIAMSLDGTITDPYNGQKDIAEKIIRAVGDPNARFQEDALRLMRAVRIATQLGFNIESNTLAAIKINAPLIENVANERIRDELFKLLSSTNPETGIEALRNCGILQIILPELEKCFGLQQEGPKHDRVYDIGQHSLASLKFCPSNDPLVRFAALLHDIGKPDTVAITEDKNVTFYNHDLSGGKIILQIAKRFNLSKKQTDKLYTLVRWHMFTLDEKQTDSSIRRFIKNIGQENIEDMMAVRIADRLGGGTVNAVSWRMDEFQKRIAQVLQKPFSISDLKINGKDIMKELNIKPGPKVGEILEKLFKEVLENSEKNNKEYLLKKINEFA